VKLFFSRVQLIISCFTTGRNSQNKTLIFFLNELTFIKKIENSPPLKRNP
jgi:hypothetical protein